MRKIGTNWRGSYISTQKRKNTRILWRNHLFYASLTELNESHHWMNPPFILQSRYQEWHAWPLLVGVKVYMYSFNVSLWSTYRNDGLFLILLMTLCYEDVERLNWCSGGYPEGRAASHPTQMYWRLTVMRGSSSSPSGSFGYMEQNNRLKTKGTHLLGSGITSLILGRKWAHLTISW